MFGLFNFRPRQAVQQAQDGAEQMVRDTGNGMFSHIKGFVKGVFNLPKIIPWMLGSTGVMLLAPNLAGSIAKAVGGEEAGEALERLGTNDQGVQNIGQRIAAAAAMGGAVGAAFNGGAGLIAGDAQENGKGGGLGGALGGFAAVAAVAIAGVGMLKNNVSHAGEGDAPRPAAPPASAAGGHARHG